MPKYIDVKKLEEYKADCCVSLTEWQQGWNDAIDTIVSEASIVDAELVKHGHWIFNPKDAIEMMFTLPKCSKCGAESVDGGSYCSNCGAKMDEIV